MNVSLTSRYEAIIEQQLASGRFANASEVVRRALDLLEEYSIEREAKLRNLKAAIQDGIDSGTSEPLNIAALKRKARAEWHATHGDSTA